MGMNPSGDSLPDDINDSVLLGVVTSTIGDVRIEDLVGNPVAIKMLIHHHKDVAQENTRLRMDLKTYETYAASYQFKIRSSRLGGIIQTASSLFLAFGVNLLTESVSAAGVATLSIGILGTAVGLFISFQE